VGGLTPFGKRPEEAHQAGRCEWWVSIEGSRRLDPGDRGGQATVQGTRHGAGRVVARER
jgi:hypothetical protein